MPGEAPPFLIIDDHFPNPTCPWYVLQADYFLYVSTKSSVYSPVYDAYSTGVFGKRVSPQWRDTSILPDMFISTIGQLCIAEHGRIWYVYRYVYFCHMLITRRVKGEIYGLTWKKVSFTRFQGNFTIGTLGSEMVVKNDGCLNERTGLHMWRE